MTQVKGLTKLDSCLGLRLKTSQLTEPGTEMSPDYEYAAGFIHFKNKPDQVK